jgi:hypothetical protein
MRAFTYVRYMALFLPILILVGAAAIAALFPTRRLQWSPNPKSVVQTEFGYTFRRELRGELRGGR